MQVRVVDDELELEIRCAGWMAVKDNIASVDILAHAVAELELEVALKTDPRVFAVLDDGCNRTCIH